MSQSLEVGSISTSAMIQQKLDVQPIVICSIDSSVAPESRGISRRQAATYCWLTSSYLLEQFCNSTHDENKIVQKMNEETDLICEANADTEHDSAEDEHDDLLSGSI